MTFVEVSFNFNYCDIRLYHVVLNTNSLYFLNKHSLLLSGMMFQLVLSDKLKSHLLTVVSSNNNNNDQQPIIHPASQQLMSRIPNYQKSSYADNISIFHGRELRKIPTANGGMGFVLQLSYADPSGEMTSVDSAPAGKGADVAWNGKSLDRRGWSSQEITIHSVNGALPINIMKKDWILLRV